MTNQQKIKEILQGADNKLCEDLARQIDLLYQPAQPQELSLRERLRQVLEGGGWTYGGQIDQILLTIQSEIEKKKIRHCDISEYYSGMRAEQKIILELLK